MGILKKTGDEKSKVTMKGHLPIASSGEVFSAKEWSTVLYMLWWSLGGQQICMYNECTCQWHTHTCTFCSSPHFFTWDSPLTLAHVLGCLHVHVHTCVIMSLEDSVVLRRDGVPISSLALGCRNMRSSKSPLANIPISYSLSRARLVETEREVGRMKFGNNGF